MAVARTPKRIIRIIRSMNDIINPAIARPLGLLKIPTRDKIIPINHSIHPTIGTQQNMRPSNASTNPAVPIPFDLEVTF